MIELVSADLHALSGARSTQPLTLAQIAALPDRELYARCQKCGFSMLTLQKEFAAYLPEVEHRRLYKKHGCHTLYEFAAKLAGMNKDTVDDIMNVHKKLEDKPILQNLIGAQGWSKVKVVATIARPETEKYWVEKVEMMSKETLKTFVKEMRKEACGQAGFFSDLAVDPAALTGLGNSLGSAPLNQVPRLGPSTPAEISPKTAITFRLDDETEIKLRIFKQKLEKKMGEPHDWNQTIKALLNIAEQEEAGAGVIAKPGIYPRDQKAAKPSTPQKSWPASQNTHNIGIRKITPTRHIPAHIKRELHQKYRGRCGYPNCKNPAEIFHHTHRFALKPTHDPTHIVPLCKPHERLAHHGLIANEESSCEKWRIRSAPEKSSPKYFIDMKVQRYRTAKK